MKVSICITVFNEEDSISKLIESLINQTKKADEIVIVDGGSKDKTLEIVKHYQKKFKYIKLLAENCTRAHGRNLGVEIAKNNIIAITDGGCVADKEWLKNITKPFETSRVDIVAGFYRMIGKNNLQKAESVFLGVTPRKFDHNFLPSTRSIAFTKNAWDVVGGFPEDNNNSAEDTDFNYKAVKLGLNYSRVKNAIVEWGIPVTLKDFYEKIKAYAKWDVRYGIWWHPTQQLMSHNIKSLSKFLRYFIALVLVVLSIYDTRLFPILLIYILSYLIWSYRKVFLEFGDWKVAIWGPVVQVVSDLAVMQGFISGIIVK